MKRSGALVFEMHHRSGRGSMRQQRYVEHWGSNRQTIAAGKQYQTSNVIGVLSLTIIIGATTPACLAGAAFFAGGGHAYGRAAGGGGRRHGWEGGFYFFFFDFGFYFLD